MGITVEQFYDLVEPMRDTGIWTKTGSTWQASDSVERKPISHREQAVRVSQVNDRTFAASNRTLYFNPSDPPPKTGDAALDRPTAAFRVI
jgi:hypothetical protein